MNDAQKEILKMLADKVITVDEAERLLKALSESETRKERSRSWHTGPHHIGNMFESLGETLASIGPMVKNTMEDVVTGLFGEDLGDLDEEELEQVEPIEGKYEIPADTLMMIINDWRGGQKRGDLVIQGVEGNSCRIDGESSKPVRVQQGAAQFVIRWAGGPLKVEVPQTVTKLRVRTKSGDIQVKQVGAEISLKTLSGNLDIADLVKNFNAKTMGGSIKLALSKEWQGNAEAHTMGGNINLAIPEGAALKVGTTTMGGTIKIDENVKKLESKDIFPGKNVKVQIGVEDTNSYIGLKTMGGDIEVRTRHAA